MKIGNRKRAEVSLRTPAVSCHIIERVPAFGIRMRSGIEDGSALRRGDVVLYRRENGMLVLHRIYKIGQDGLYLLGDPQNAFYGPVRRALVKGKMTGMVRDGRYMDVGNPGYRMLSVVWLWLRPARRAIMVPAARLRRMVRFALFRRNNKRYNK